MPTCHRGIRGLATAPRRVARVLVCPQLCCGIGTPCCGCAAAQTVNLNYGGFICVGGAHSSHVAMLVNSVWTVGPKFDKFDEHFPNYRGAS